jgi:DNA polymerase IV
MNQSMSGSIQKEKGYHRIMHIDMDAFYVSVELLKRPELRGLPVIIGGKSPRGVVLTCSYQARKYGVCSAMPSIKAMRLCPEAVWLRGDFATYEYYSKRVFDILRRYSPDVYPLSIDEGRLDLTGSESLFGPASGIAHRIVNEIRDELGLPASAGLANSGVTAKIAAELAKPFGLIVVFPGKEASFLAPVPIKYIPGAGKVSQQTFYRYGYRMIGDLSAQPLEVLIRQFGSWASTLERIAHGRSKPAQPHTPVSPSRSNESTFRQDLFDPEHIRAEVRRLVEKLAYRLRRSNLKAGTVTVKIRDGKFNTITRSQSLKTPTDKDHILFQTAEKLVLSNLPAQTGIRLLGVSTQKLTSGTGQKSLFVDSGEQNYDRFYTAVDTIKQKYGKQSVWFGASPRNTIRKIPATTPGIPQTLKNLNPC